MSYTISTVAPPTITPNDDVSVLYGAVYGRDGQPVPFVPIEANIVQTPLEDADTSGNAFIKRDPVRVVTQRDGTFQMTLLRGLWCQFTIGEDYYAGELEIPDCPLIPLSDWLYPYPVRIAWFAGPDLDTVTEVTAIASDSEYGTVFDLPAAVGDTLYVGLGALRSDNQVYISESAPALDRTFVGLSESVEQWSENELFSFRKLDASTPGVAAISHERDADAQLSEWPSVPAVVRNEPPFYAPADSPEQTPDPLFPLLVTFS